MRKPPVFITQAVFLCDFLDTIRVDKPHSETFSVTGAYTVTVISRISMKSIIIALLFACLAILSSCLKTEVNPDINTAPAKDIISPLSNPGTIIGSIPDPSVIIVKAAPQIAGDWTLVSDSISNTIEVSDHLTITGYSGQPGDHFNFTADGKLYIAEADKKDTTNYTITRDNKIAVSYPNQAIVTNYAASLNVFKPVDLTRQSVTLVSAVITPGGSTFRTIHLKK
ncbi:MAG: hypothetical protein JWQ66_1435 [Mucilaginibacter sp.]|nr:hypothetical protein [Mucilaginibacter sp.]